MTNRAKNDIDGDAYIIYGDDYVDQQPPDVVELTRGQWLWRQRHWIVFAAAFLIPFVILTLIGLVADRFSHRTNDQPSMASPIVAAASPSPASPVVGAWPQNMIFNAHTIPAMIRDEIVTATARHGYRFEGRAGEVWHITVEPEDTFDPQLRLYEPSGGELVYNDDRTTEDPSADIRVVLPADGTYRLLVESAPKSGGTIGTYWLTVFGE